MAPLLYQVITSPPCRAVLMLARAIGLNMDLENVNLMTQEHLKPEFLKLNPQHTVPVLNDDGFIIWDSHAINAYLVSKYATDDTLYPRDIKKRAIVDQRLHFDSGITFTILKQISVPLRSKTMKVVPENLKAEVRDAYRFVEAFLEGNKWICGDFVTLADIHFVATISSLQVFEPLTAEYPRTNTWLENCKKEDWYEANVKGLEERNKLYLTLMKS